VRAGARALHIVEVGVRDGLQAEPRVVPTSRKIELIGELINVGLRRLEVASFVNARRVPQMADAEDIVAALSQTTGVSYIGLVLNLRGAERAVQTKIHEIGTAVPATDTFGVRNQGQTSDDAQTELKKIVEHAKAAGMPVQCAISMAFGCPFEGKVSEQRVIDLARRAADLDITEIGLADTIGVAVPAQVTDLFGRLREAVPHLPLRAHFHDTRNTGVANVWAAVQTGVSGIDASVGGLGGCPFAPGAGGNVATEDVAYLLSTSGIETGIDLSRLIAIARRANANLGRAPAVGLAGAGLPERRP
jgi:hydroxymethylglutaryl-CoA lyase